MLKILKEGKKQDSLMLSIIFLAQLNKKVPKKTAIIQQSIILQKHKYALPSLCWKERFTLTNQWFDIMYF